MGARATVVAAGRAWLGEAGYDPVYGARPLRRLMQTQLEDRLARALLAGQVGEGATITFDVNAARDGLEITPAA